LKELEDDDAQQEEADCDENAVEHDGSEAREKTRAD
jgi:hypothetical protein